MKGLLIFWNMVLTIGLIIALLMAGGIGDNREYIKENRVAIVEVNEKLIEVIEVVNKIPPILKQ